MTKTATISLQQEIAQCRLCSARFAQTATAHRPKPVVWFEKSPRILISSQAPGARVHDVGMPFWDRSGDRLREWLGLDKETFYDTSQVAIVPMAFCFPGYDAAGSDLPPPPICRNTWHDRVMRFLDQPPLTVLIGGYAQKYHLGVKTGVTETVRGWRDHAPQVFPLPHPSWRNTAWLKKNPWFAAEVLPALRARVRTALE